MISRKFYYSLLTLIALLSFRFYSAYFYADLNSDDAINILMLHDYHLPHDLYYWGQDRYGSLVPLIGQLFLKIFHCSPLLAESITHCILLILGFLGFSTLFKNDLSKLAFAIIWFFPPFHMVDLFRFNLGLQCCILGCIAGLFTYSYSGKHTISHSVKNGVLLLIVILAGVMIWVSDLAVPTIALIPAIHGYFYIRKTNTSLKNLIRQGEIYYLIIGILLIGLFIPYAKSQSVNVNDYETLNDFSTAFASLKLFLESIIQIILFQAHEPFTSIYTIALLIFGIYFFSKNKTQTNFDPATKNWILVFLLSAVITFVIILFSKWSFINGVPRRYFIPIYISFWIIFLLVLESRKKQNPKLNYSVIFSIIILGGAGAIYNLKFIYPKSLKPKAELATEFTNLGEIGLIGDYWNSYLNSIADPDNIKATPFEGSGSVRNWELATIAVQKKDIYLVRDNWLENFPDSITQFGATLVQNGQPFILGGTHICKYKKTESKN